ncbi:MAG TPA: hypothetical protein VF796_08580 [Humisphaera sp.]
MSHPARTPSRVRTCLRRVTLARLGVAVVLAGTAATAGGCGPLALATHALTRQEVQASYAGLKGQTVTVMVTADRGTKIEHPKIQLDIAQSLVAGMKESQNRKAEELAGTTFPDKSSPLNVFTYQKMYPQVDYEPITQLAPRFEVSRLIYVEIESFTLNPADVVELFRGELTARVRVIEVTGTGPGATAKVAFDDKVTAKFPEKAPDAGTPNLDRRTTYLGTVGRFTTETLKRFVAYEQ